MTDCFVPFSPKDWITYDGRRVAGGVGLMVDTSYGLTENALPLDLYLPLDAPTDEDLWADQSCARLSPTSN